MSIALVAGALAGAFAHPSAGAFAHPSPDTAARLHTKLVRSEPAAGAVVAPPAAIRLWFSEPVNVGLTGLTLTGPDGRVVKTVRATRAEHPDAPVVVAVNAVLAPGAYVAAWRTASADGHPVKGSFRFSIASGR
jgi:methionine-rich copper-binding protein CopC